MTDFLRKSVIGQFEAALAMFHDCLQQCPEQHWDGVIGNYPFWQVAYHTLCFVDLYLAPNEASFVMRDLHPKGWDEFNEEFPSRRFTKEELLGYTAICREKIPTVLTAETADVLQGPSGFPRLAFSRAELHLYNLRHLQHHTGQLSAYLRRAKIDTKWVKTGWA